MGIIRTLSTVAGAGCLLVLAGCGSSEQTAYGTAGATGTYAPSPAQRGYYKVGKPYQIAGVWYHPREDFQLVETGIASWYGDEFHGKMTANGEIFDRDALTAAHPTLQMPAVVRVTNLDNGRSVVVRVNDRGPYARGRVIDVSRRTARVLGFEGSGTAKVRVEVMPEESMRLAGVAREGNLAQVEAFMARRHGSARNMPEVQVAQAPVTPSAIWVQAGAFAVAENAYRLQSELSAYGRATIAPASVNGRQLYRVRMGPLTDVTHADTLLTRIAEAGHPLATVVVE